MRMYDLIEQKKRGMKLSKAQIEFIVNGFTDGSIPDYQMSAFLMAVYFKGMDKEETFNLTMAMAHSGDMLNFSAIEGKKVDKHSTGGVGDKTTLIVGPLVASLGIPVAITRNSDVTLSPTDRTNSILSKFGNSSDVIVISNHVNAGGGDSHCVMNI